MAPAVGVSGHLEVRIGVCDLVSFSRPIMSLRIRKKLRLSDVADKMNEWTEMNIGWSCG